MKTFIRHIYVQRSLLTYVRSPAGTTAENIFIWWPPDNMWWPPDSDVVASGHALHRYMVATTYLHKKNKEYHIHRYLVVTR